LSCPFPIPFRVLSTRATDRQPFEPVSCQVVCPSVDSYTSTFLRFFSLIYQHASQPATHRSLRAIARAPSLAPSRVLIWEHGLITHTHTHTLSLLDPRHSPSNSLVVRPLRDHLPYNVVTAWGARVTVLPAWALGQRIAPINLM